MAVRDENDLHGRKLLRGKRERRKAAEIKRDISKNGIGQDIFLLKADPQSSVSQIGDGVAPFQDFTDVRPDGWKNRGLFFLLFEGVGGETPLQEAEESGRIFLGKPEQIKANAIVVFTYKGRAARGLAKFRPAAIIIAISDSFETMNNLCLRWAVNSLFIDKIDKQHAAIEEAKDLILNAGLVNKGDLVIFLSRAPFSEKGRSDFLHFEVM